MGSRDLVGDGTLVERFADGLIQALRYLAPLPRSAKLPSFD
jgi:hypothetical protein